MDKKYESVKFSELKIGEEFECDVFMGISPCYDVCIKIEEETGQIIEIDEKTGDIKYGCRFLIPKGEIVSKVIK